MPVRQLLADYLLSHQEELLARLITAAGEAGETAEVRELTQTPGYAQAIATLLQLLAQNVADPADRRAFHYAHQRAQERFRESLAATQLLRLAGLHRHILTGLITERFGHDPAQLRPMLEILDGQIAELELSFTEAYQSARDRQWQASQTKYFALFENASEAIVSFRPGTSADSGDSGDDPEGTDDAGRIIEANVQAERLCGLARAKMMGQDFAGLFAPEHREQVRWLVEQQGGSSNIRLEDLSILRPDGLTVPVSISCNWVVVDGEGVAQVIMRDVTQLRQIQRELQNYAEQLEERVAARTRELQFSEERYRALFHQEQRRGRHLSLINDVQKAALVAPASTSQDLDNFLHQATAAIQTHFRTCDVTLFLREGARHELVGNAQDEHQDESKDGGEDALIVVAEVGGHGLSMPVGGRMPLEGGLPGRVLLSGEMLNRGVKSLHSQTAYLDAGSVEEMSALEARAPGVHRESRAEIGVPLILDEEPVGVILVQSEEDNAFDARDGIALQTASAIIAAHLRGSRLFREMNDLSEFLQTLVSTMLHSLMVIDRDGRIRLVNERLCLLLHHTEDELKGQPAERVFGRAAMENYNLEAIMRDVTEHGTPREIPEVHLWTPEATYIFDLRLSRAFFKGQAQVVVLMINLTLRWRKTYQLQLMNEMGRLFQASLDIDQVLYTVLTCITAGSALGFNRAFLLLRDNNIEGREVLKGAMALGPSSHDEAARIWQEMSRVEASLQELLANSPDFDSNNPTPLQSRAMRLTIDLNNPCFSGLARAIRDCRAVNLSHDELLGGFGPDAPLPDRFQNQCAAAGDLWTTPEIAVAPLVSKDRLVGVVLADNLYSGSPIEPDDIQLLDTLAQGASLTVDNALTYQALQKAQREVASAERLVAVGEMAARVSHEIRNPLATIGGFARNVLKRVDDRELVRKKVGVIVEEVERLEELLTDLLDMARARPLLLEGHNINALVNHALLLAEADIKASGVTVEKYLADLPPILVDRSRLLQALLNTMRNGAQAMPNGGTLSVSTYGWNQAELDGQGTFFDGAMPSDASASNASENANNKRFLIIEIKDTGVGISEQAVKQVFDPFFSTKIQGSGLGLAVTRRIIQDHGGDIDVRSSPGQGTTFFLRLPFRTAASAAQDGMGQDGAAENPSAQLALAHWAEDE